MKNKKIIIPDQLKKYVIQDIDKNFHKQNDIAKGGQGTVWLAIDNQKKKYAIKEFFIDENNPERQVKRYLLECAAMSRAQHPFVVVFCGMTEVFPFQTVTEYVSTVNLTVFLTDKHFKSQNHNGTCLTKIAIAISNAMMFLHKINIIHRDLKPSNILIGTDFLPKICDFGLAHLHDQEKIMTSELGTPIWMAPEVIRGDSYNEKCDIFSFSMILYQMATHKVPMLGLTSTHIMEKYKNEQFRPSFPHSPKISKPLQELIINCWSEDPEKRPSFSQIFEKFANDEVSFPHCNSKSIKSFVEKLKADDQKRTIIPPFEVFKHRKTRENEQKDKPENENIQNKSKKKAEDDEGSSDHKKKTRKTKQKVKNDDSEEEKEEYSHENAKTKKTQETKKRKKKKQTTDDEYSEEENELRQRKTRSDYSEEEEKNLRKKARKRKTRSDYSDDEEKSLRKKAPKRKTRSDYSDDEEKSLRKKARKRKTRSDYSDDDESLRKKARKKKIRINYSDDENLRKKARKRKIRSDYSDDDDDESLRNKRLKRKIRSDYSDDDYRKKKAQKGRKIRMQSDYSTEEEHEKEKRKKARRKHSSDDDHYRKMKAQKYQGEVQRGGGGGDCRKRRARAKRESSESDSSESGSGDEHLHPRKIKSAARKSNLLREEADHSNRNRNRRYSGRYRDDKGRLIFDVDTFFTSASKSRQTPSSSPSLDGYEISDSFKKQSSKMPLFQSQTSTRTKKRKPAPNLQITTPSSSSYSSYESSSQPNSRNASYSRLSSRAPVSIETLNDVRHPMFRIELEKVGKKDFARFLKVLKKHLTSPTPMKELVLLLRKTDELIEDEECLCFFSEKKVFEFLPISNSESNDEIVDISIEILNKVCQFCPQFIDENFETSMLSLINVRPIESAKLLRVYSMSFDSIENPWNLLDMLIVHKKKFNKTTAGSIVVKTLVYLIQNYKNYRKNRMSNCRGVITFFLNSTVKKNVIAAYKAASVLYDDEFELPFKKIRVDMEDPELVDSVISLFDKMETVPPVKSIIFSLLKIAKKDEKAADVLAKMARNYETACILINSRVEWMLNKLPTYAATLKIFAEATSKYRDLQKIVVSDFEIAAELFVCSCKSEKKEESFFYFDKILSKLNFSQGFLETLREKRFFQYFFRGITEIYDDDAILPCIRALKFLIQIGYCEEFSIFVKTLKKYVKSDGKIADEAQSCLIILSSSNRKRD